MKHKVIGLVSGGKDSLYSLAHCVANGHEVLALANLHPAHSGESRVIHEEPDLDSFMYQTVGHSLVHLYAEALDIPLYRRAISGSAQQSGTYYDTSSQTIVNDETEDMYLLIRDVVNHHPDATALSAGAILSTYQRTRVESIAVRLGLCPLAYLWQYPALPPSPHRSESLTGLLDDMAVAGCDARIIKIASGGIPPKLMSSNVADPAVGRRLVNGLAPFFDGDGSEFELRGAVLGEGGEFETLALAGPGSLWKKRISVEFGETRPGDGGTWYIDLISANVAELQDNSYKDVPLPAALDLQFTSVLQKADSISEPHFVADTVGLTRSAWTQTPSIIRSRNMIELNNISSTSNKSSAAEQLRDIVASIPKHLAKHDVPTNPQSITTSQNIASVLLTIRSMKDFAAINGVYSQHLWPDGLPLPPARVTISSSLPEDVYVTLSMVLDTNPRAVTGRQGIHVQSLSYWAPANIGPYSQAINVSISPLQHDAVSTPDPQQSAMALVYMAGQIPLQPSSMAISTGSFQEKAVLALQHLWRVAQERSIDLWAGPGVAYLADDSGNHSVLTWRAKMAAQIWNLAHSVDTHGVDRAHGPSTDVNDPENSDDEADYDVWDAQWKGRAHTGSAQHIKAGDHLHTLPQTDVLNHLQIQRVAELYHEDVIRPHFFVPPFTVAQVNELPRQAPIEWSAQGLAGLHVSIKQGECTLSAFQKDLDSDILVSGVVIEHGHPPNTTHDYSNQFHDRGMPKALTAFITIVLRADCSQQQVVKRLTSTANLLQSIFADSDQLSSELVSSQVWLNLGLNAATPEFLACSEVLSKASVIQCHHVWARQNIVEPLEGSGTQSRAPALEEVAAVATCRIDTCL